MVYTKRTVKNRKKIKRKTTTFETCSDMEREERSHEGTAKHAHDIQKHCDLYSYCDSYSYCTSLLLLLRLLLLLFLLTGTLTLPTIDGEHQGSEHQHQCSPRSGASPLPPTHTVTLTLSALCSYSYSDSCTYCYFSCSLVLVPCQKLMVNIRAPNTNTNVHHVEGHLRFLLPML